MKNNIAAAMPRNCAFVAVMILALTVSVATPAAAQCPVSMTVSYTPVQHLGLADVDLEHFESASLLFTVHISNTGSSEAYAQIHVQLMVLLADGTSYPDAVVFSTECFAIPTGGKTITNADIGNTKEIKTQSFTYDHDAKNRVQDIALATGSFPSGRYV